MTLEQLMAFTVTSDHARQEQVWDGVSPSYNKEPYHIRRQLTEGAVRASDRRAQFVGSTSMRPPVARSCATSSSMTMAAGCKIRRLLDRLVTEKLQARGRDAAGRGLEVDRGRHRLPLWPRRRSASPDRRDRRPHRGGATPASPR